MLYSAFRVFQESIPDDLEIFNIKEQTLQTVKDESSPLSSVYEVVEEEPNIIELNRTFENLSKLSKMKKEHERREWRGDFSERINFFPSENTQIKSNVSENTKKVKICKIENSEEKSKVSLNISNNSSVSKKKRMEKDFENNLFFNFTGVDDNVTLSCSSILYLRKEFLHFYLKEKTRKYEFVYSFLLLEMENMEKEIKKQRMIERYPSFSKQKLDILLMDEYSPEKKTSKHKKYRKNCQNKKKKFLFNIGYIKNKSQTKNNQMETCNRKKTQRKFSFSKFSIRNRNFSRNQKSNVQSSISNPTKEESKTKKEKKNIQIWSDDYFKRKNFSILFSNKRQFSSIIHSNNFDFTKKYSFTESEQKLQCERENKSNIDISISNELGVKKNKKHFNVLIFACFYGIYDEINFLLSRVSPAEYSNQAIIEACTGSTITREQKKGKFYKTVYNLICDSRTNSTVFNHYPLKAACFNGHTEIVKLLLSENLSKNIDKVVGLEMVEICLAKGFEDILELLFFVDKRIGWGLTQEKSLKEYMKKCCECGGYKCLDVILRIPVARKIVNICFVENVFCRFSKVKIIEEKKNCLKSLILVFFENLNDNLEEFQKNYRKWGTKFPMFISFLEDLKKEIEKKKKILDTNFYLFRVNLKKNDKILNPLVFNYFYESICDIEKTKKKIKEMKEEEIEKIFKTLLQKKSPNIENCSAKKEIKVESFQLSSSDSKNEKENNFSQQMKNMEIGFCCPITQSIMVDPVILIESGQTYEKKAIKNWLKYNRTDPLTRQSLHDTKLVENRALRSQILEWKKSKKLFVKDL